MGNLIKLGLARNSHQPTAAGAYLPESTALRSDKGLDVLTSTPARFVSRASCISGHQRALASRPGEKCGLVVVSLGSAHQKTRRPDTAEHRDRLGSVGWAACLLMRLGSLWCWSIEQPDGVFAIVTTYLAELVEDQGS